MSKQLPYVIRGKLLASLSFHLFSACSTADRGPASTPKLLLAMFVAGSLKSPESGLEEFVPRWPESMRTFGTSSSLLRLQPFPDVIFRLEEDFFGEKQIHGCDIDAKVVKCS